MCFIVNIEIWFFIGRFFFYIFIIVFFFCYYSDSDIEFFFIKMNVGIIYCGDLRIFGDGVGVSWSYFWIIELFKEDNKNYELGLCCFKNKIVYYLGVVKCVFVRKI